MTTPAVSTLPPFARRRSITALIRSFDARLKTRIGAQLAKLVGGLVALGYGLAVPFAARAPAGDRAASALVHALAWLSWLSAGAIALSACRRASDDDGAALDELALGRGFSLRDLGWARAVAPARRVARVVGIPTLLLALLAFGFARRAALLPARAVLALGALGYVGLLSVSIALLVYLAKSVGPERPRTTLLLLVFVPHVLHTLVPQVPSLPHVLGWVLDELGRFGARAP